MQLAQLRRPAQAAALSATGYRPVVLTSFVLPIRPAMIGPPSCSPRLPGASGARLPQQGVEGRRYASVKSQGQYKIPNKKTIAKRLGAKRTGDQFVIPGNIIYKQRGTIWHAGENAIRGRDHTIHAAVEGYVKYYRDPDRHPDKQYIGVAFNKEDTLPYPRNEPRRRKLNMVPVKRKMSPKSEELTPSGLPRRVVIPGNVYDVPALAKLVWTKDRRREVKEARRAAKRLAKSAAAAAATNATATTPSDAPSTGGAANAETNNAAAPLAPVDEATSELALATRIPTTRAEQRKFIHPIEFIRKRWLERRRTRTLHFNPANYSYAESNARIGRLSGRTMYTPPWKLGGRKSRFRAKRKRRERELVREREEAAADRIRKREKKIEEEKKKAARLAKQIAAGAGRKANKAKQEKPLLVDGPVQEAKPVEGKQEGKPVEGKSESKPVEGSKENKPVEGSKENKSE